MDLEGILLSETSQTEKVGQGKIRLVQKSKNIKLTEMESRMVVARWQRNGGSWKMLEYRLLVTRSIHSRALMYSTMTIGNC